MPAHISARSLGSNSLCLYITSAIAETIGVFLLCSAARASIAEVNFWFLLKSSIG